MTPVTPPDPSAGHRAAKLGEVPRSDVVNGATVPRTIE